MSKVTGVTVAQRSPVVAALKVVLLLSGWAVAGGLGLKLRELPEPEPMPLPVPAAESKFDRMFREWTADPKLAGALIAFCLLDENGQTVFASPLAATAL